MDKEYINFLKKKIDSHDTKSRNAALSYQETGEKRYYTSQINEEYYLRALNDSMAKENKRDMEGEKQGRVISALLHSAEQYKAIYSAEEALEKTINDLSIAKMFS